MSAWRRGAAAVVVGGSLLGVSPTRLPVPPRPAAAPAPRPAQAAPASVELGWVRIPAGSFEMGCVPTDPECRPNERPRHRVTISQPFDLMATEITVGSFREYSRETGTDLPRQPLWNDSDRHPVVNVTWQEVLGFCRWAGGRLPTEAEWELAARGGYPDRIYPWGDTFVAERLNGGGDDPRAPSDPFRYTAPVGSFPPNDHGLYDVSGNVWEWVADWFGGRYYDRSPERDPPGPPRGEFRVMRGGSWDSSPTSLRLSFRFRLSPIGRYNLYIGGRCARDV